MWPQDHTTFFGVICDSSNDVSCRCYAGGKLNRYMNLLCESVDRLLFIPDIFLRIFISTLIDYGSLEYCSLKLSFRNVTLILHCKN